MASTEKMEVEPPAHNPQDESQVEGKDASKSGDTGASQEVLNTEDGGAGDSTAAKGQDPQPPAMEPAAGEQQAPAVQDIPAENHEPMEQDVGPADQTANPSVQTSAEQHGAVNPEDPQNPQPTQEAPEIPGDLGEPQQGSHASGDPQSTQDPNQDPQQTEDPTQNQQDPGQDPPDPNIAEGLPPADEGSAEAERDPSRPPSTTHVPLLPLNRAEMVNIVLAGHQPNSAISRPPAKLKLPLPSEGFTCDQCSDRFILPSSLALHKSRRTMEIAFKCKPCDKTCLFDNKCRFLEHLDGHGMTPDSLDPESVDVSALTASDLSAPTRVIPALSSRVLTGPPRMVKMGHVEKVDRPAEVSCPMCNTLCTTATVASHMCPPAGSDALETVPPRCPECAQPCPSECSLLAHHGLHKPDLWPYPYVCPECSVKVLGTHDEYRRHVVASCLHLTRDLKTCCSVCLIEVGDVKSHMLQTHVQKLYKCRKCPLAFESINGFNSHVKAKHGTETILGDTPYMPILKCPFCAATFNHPKTLREHLGSKKHGDKQLETVRFVFRCPESECGVDYGRKELLSDHIRQRHPDFQFAALEPKVDLEPLVAPPPAVVVAAELVPAQAVVPAPVAMPSALVTGRMGRPRATIAPDGTTVAIKKEPAPPGRRSVVVHKCAACHVEFKRKHLFVDHARDHLAVGVPLCILCNVAFDSHEVLKAHIAEHAAEIGSDRCGMCFAKLGSRDALQLHLESEHELRDFTCPHCPAQFGPLSELLGHIFAKHRAAAKGRPARPPVVPKDVSQPPPLLPAAVVDDDEEEDDDVPLSQLSAKKAALKRAINNAELAGKASPAPGEKRKSAGKGAGRGGKRQRNEDEPPPKLSRVVKRSQSPDEQEFVERPAPAPPSTGYRCVCCGFQAEARADFVAHVALHRQAGQHQCPECGQCYSTKPSLLKHLLLVHRLREPPPEVAEMDRERESQKWELLTQDLEPDQCHVCRARCGDEERLQRHLRMHGRGALREHQRQQARRHRRQAPPEDGRAETLEDIASFVAGGSGAAAAPDEDEDAEEVIELEMKEGQITQKQFRKGVPLVQQDESSDEEAEQAPQGNGESAADPAPGKAKPQPAPEVISANGHEEGSAAPVAAATSA